MRVAVVTPILPVPQDPTRGRFIFETAKALSKRAEVRVFLTQARYPSFLPGSGGNAHLVGEGFELPGLDVIPLSYLAIPLLSRVINGWVAGRVLRKEVAEFNPDIVIGYWIYPEGAAAVRAARYQGCPAVIGAFGTDLNGRTGLNDWLTRRALHAADCIINVSEDMTRHTKAHFKVASSKVHTVVNGFNTSIFHPCPEPRLRAAHGLPSDGPLIVYVGRLIEAKGLKELLQAQVRLIQDYPGVQLAIIGEGPFRAQLESLIQDLGLSHNAHLLGGKLPEEVAQWMSSAQVLTLPSWTEGYPNVLIEALACGCPIVATSVGGIPEIVREDNGLLVPPHQSDALANALKAALQKNWDRAAIAAQMRRTWDDVAQETLVICQGLVT